MMIPKKTLGISIKKGRNKRQDLGRRTKFNIRA